MSTLSNNNLLDVFTTSSDYLSDISVTSVNLVFGLYLRFLKVFGKLSNLFWQFLHYWGIYHFVNGPKRTNHLANWSHWLASVCIFTIRVG